MSRTGPGDRVTSSSKHAGTSLIQLGANPYCLRPIPQVLLILLLLLSLVADLSVAQTRECTPPEFRALILYSLLRGTTWPEDTTNSKAPYVLGLLGEDKVGEPWLSEMEAKGTKERPIVIRRKCQNAADAKGCHVVFITVSGKSELAALLNELKRLSIVTVGESDEFTRVGGMINFTFGQKKNFEFSKNAIQRSGLEITSKLLVCGQQLP